MHSFWFTKENIRIFNPSIFNLQNNSFHLQSISSIPQFDTTNYSHSSQSYINQNFHVVYLLYTFLYISFPTKQHIHLPISFTIHHVFFLIYNFFLSLHISIEYISHRVFLSGNHWNQKRGSSGRNKKSPIAKIENSCQRNILPAFIVTNIKRNKLDIFFVVQMDFSGL